MEAGPGAGGGPIRIGSELVGDVALRVTSKLVALAVSTVRRDPGGPATAEAAADRNLGKKTEASYSQSLEV